MKISIKTKYLIPAGCILAGALFAVLSMTSYELWNPVKGPMSGFLPFVSGIMLFFAGILGLFQARSAKEPLYHRDNWLLVLCVLIVIGANYIIGFLPSLFLFSFGWLRFKERCSWRATIITMSILLVMIVGIFMLWLDIPFEKGLLFRGLFV